MDISRVHVRTSLLTSRVESKKQEKERFKLTEFICMYVKKKSGPKFCVGLCGEKRREEGSERRKDVEELQVMEEDRGKTGLCSSQKSLFAVAHTREQVVSGAALPLPTLTGKQASSTSLSLNIKAELHRIPWKSSKLHSAFSTSRFILDQVYCGS